MAFKLASLFVEIIGESGKLTTEFKQTQKRARTFDKNLAKIGRRGSALFLGYATQAAATNAALLALYKTQSASIDQLAKDSSKLGIVTDRLQAIQLAGELGGLDNSKLTTSLQRMTRRVSEAAIGLGEARTAIKDLGLDAQVLARQSPDQIFTKVLTELQKITDEKDRVRIAFKFFDTEGVDLVNVTTKELERANLQIERMGGGLSKLDVAQVERANDAITLIKQNARLAGQRITVELAKTVELVALEFYEASLQSEQFDKTIQSLTRNALQGFAKVVTAVGGTLSFISQNPEVAEFGAIGYLLLGKRGLALGAVLGAAYGQYEKIAGGIADRTRRDIERYEEAIKRLEGQEVGGFTKFRDKLFGTDQVQRIADARIRVDELRVSLKNLEAGFGADGDPLLLENITGTLGESFSNLGGSILRNLDAAANESGDVVKSSLERTNENVKLSISQLEALAKKSAEVASQRIAADSANRVNGNEYENASGQFETRLSAEAQQNLRIRGLQAEHDQAMLQDQKRFQDQWLTFQSVGAKARAQILIGELSGALSTLGQHSKRWFKISKIAGIADAFISVQQGIAQALKLPFPANLAAGATVALKGAAIITQLKNAKYGGTGSVDTSTPSANQASYSTPDVSSPGGQITNGTNTTTEAAVVDTPTPFLQLNILESGFADKEKLREVVVEQIGIASDQFELNIDPETMKLAANSI